MASSLQNALGNGAKRIAMAAEFRPLPFLGNAHLQTLLGHLLRGPRVYHPTRVHVIYLPDGDGMVLHDSVPTGWKDGDRIVVVLHGLTGSHASPQVQRITVMLLAGGVRVVRLDLRGSGLGLPLARGFYHGGCSDDVRAALAEVHRWAPTSPIALVGFSLGGNIALKLAGELNEHPAPGLDRIGALAPPIDLEACVKLISRRANRVYEAYFVRDLVRNAEARQRHFPDLPPLQWPRRMTIRLFDDLYTAPRRGFADSTDYYRQASSRPYISRIPTPTLILTAADDPFVAIEPFLELKLPAHVTLRVQPRGGHLGFVGPDGAGGIRWGERQMAHWVLQTHV